MASAMNWFSGMASVPANTLLCLIQRRENGLDTDEELLAQLCRHDCAGTAREQARTQIRLQIGNDP